MSDGSIYADVRVDLSALKAMLAELPSREEKILAKAAFDVENRAKDNITDNDQVDTGYMRAAVATMQQSRFTWLVVAGAEYSLYQEMGTRFMRARPFLFPALEAIRPKFLEAWNKLVK